MPEPKATMSVSELQLAALANELAALSSRLSAVAATAAEQPEKSLAMYNWPSVDNGMRMLRNFVSRAEESRLAAQLGNPLQAGQLKPRSTAQKRAAEDKAKIESFTAKQGKTKATKKKG